jgi:hypothetical protein
MYAVGRFAFTVLVLLSLRRSRSYVYVYCLSLHPRLLFRGFFRVTDSMDHGGLRYQHLRCFDFTGGATADKQPEDELFGWEKLTSTQRQQVRRAWVGEPEQERKKASKVALRTGKPVRFSVGSVGSVMPHCGAASTATASAAFPATPAASVGMSPAASSPSANGLAALVDELCNQGLLSVGQSVWLAANLHLPVIVGTFELYQFTGDTRDFLDTIVHAFNAQYSA